MEEIKFSIIVPIYKVEKFLDKCITSILSQSYKNFELILVDDGSPDNCPNICDRYKNEDSRIKVIHKRNGGLVSARNIGLENCSGDYVCYVDGDDWVKSDFLKTIYDDGIKNFHPDIIVFNLLKKYNDYEEELPFYPSAGFYNKERLQQEIYPYMMFDNRKKFCTGLVFPTGAGKAFKRDLLKEHCCREEKIRMGEDNAFVFECIYYAESIYFLNETIYIYNKTNEGSITSTYDVTRFDNNKLLLEYIQTNLKGKEYYLDLEINAFIVYWTIMAIFHEIKTKQKFMQSRKHIKLKLKETKVLEKVTLEGLPFSAKIYVILLRLHLYSLTLILSKIVNWKRQRK